MSPENLSGYGVDLDVRHLLFGDVRELGFLEVGGDPQFVISGDRKDRLAGADWRTHIDWLSDHVAVARGIQVRVAEVGFGGFQVCLGLFHLGLGGFDLLRLQINLLGTGF